jgi:subtilisin
MNRRNDTEFININELKKKQIVDKIPEPIIYSPEDYGISAKYTGEKVKILIIDSGVPTHKNIKNKKESHNFADENGETNDDTGHSTIVSGLIGSKNKQSLIGIAYNSELLFAKIINNKGDSDYNSIVSSILWGVVEDVDIIVMALGSQYDYKILHDAIIKARNRGICIFAAAGNHINEEGSEINYPARYPEVFSVGNLTRSKKTNLKILEKVDFAIKNKMTYSTYLKNKYVKTSGSSIATAIVAGIGSILIEKNKRTSKKNMPTKIYTELQKIIG